MIRKLKKLSKIIAYGINVKSYIGCAVFFFVLAVTVIMLGGSDAIMLGATYLFTAGIMIKQIEGSLTYTGFAAASPKRRALEIWLPDVMDLITGAFVFAVLLMLIWVKGIFGTEQNFQYGTGFVFAGIVGAVIMVYYVLCMKYMLISTAFFVVAYVVVFMYAEPSAFQMGVAEGALCGALIVLFGVVLAGICRRLLYRRPLSRYAVGMELRK
ncbi:MAG: hypothetical protein NC300_09375 [Bacteroidales bacterium]|nr:hypothetical protein [Clostridium sp.]MCM1204341.1 hypothetical protein [Bacteroidales bacterium]